MVNDKEIDIITDHIYEIERAVEGLKEALEKQGQGYFAELAERIVNQCRDRRNDWDMCTEYWRKRGAEEPYGLLAELKEANDGGV